jgi:hypothetical protein
MIDLSSVFMKKLFFLYALLSSLPTLAQNPATDSSATVVHYQFALNGTLDKSIVKRLLFISQNRLTIENKWYKFEPVATYRFGYVQPNGLRKVDLENDVFLLAESHFLPRKRLFPSVIANFETSPSLRKLHNRWLVGVGGGTQWKHQHKHFFQFNLYGLYEESNFNAFSYQVWRLMPSVKGRHSVAKNQIGVVYGASYAVALDNADNYRVRTFIKPYLKIRKNIDFNVLYDIWYEGLVNETQPREISIFTFGFTFSNL